ncbi:MAG: DUF2911 domain-containing protein [Longimicrobiales bacterium]|nr:DUF2911 domain-containing protein [Longimicrobiales bacterium]
MIVLWVNFPGEARSRTSLQAFSSAAATAHLCAEGETSSVGLLAYGVWWRTGANSATQFGFDRDITIDGEVIPVGFYTLSSFPEADGGTLIINRRTGQGGQSYDEAENQAGITMRRDSLDEHVEVF